MTTGKPARRTNRHVLKLWTDQFVAMQLGAKRADVRRCDDREYRRGDELLYRDFAARTGEYSGMALLARVTHLTRAAGMLDLFGRDMTPVHQDDRSTNHCILGQSRCSSPRTCSEAGRCLEAWEPTRQTLPIVVLSVEVLEIGKYDALNATTPGDLVESKAPKIRAVVAGPESSSTPRYFTCQCTSSNHGKLTGCSGTGAEITGGLCAFCFADKECRRVSLQQGAKP